ncbi:MAG: hypothetical protein GX051_03325 [Clostridiales bacterium]|nr:hypothetical protein [Clostridiales bacterium]
MKRSLSLLLAVCLAFALVAGAFAAPSSEAVLPTASVKFVEGKDFATTEGFTDFPIGNYDTDYLIGAVLTLENTGSGYDNYFVDCLLTLDAATEAKLLGKYSGRFGTFAWQGSTAYTAIDAGTYAVMSEMGYPMTVAEVADEVGTFYCAFSADPYTFDESLNVSLALKLYEEPVDSAAPVYIDAQKTIDSDNVEKCFTKTLPEVDVQLINASDFAVTDVFKDFAVECDSDFTVGAIFNVSDPGKGYGEYVADFVLNLDKAAKIRLFGNYGRYGWLEGTAGWYDAAEGNHMIMNSADMAIDFNYVANSVETFYCIFTAKGDSFSGDLGVNLNLKLFKSPEDGETPVYLAPTLTSTSDNIALTFTSVIPTATITSVQGADFASTPVFSAIDSTKYDLSKAIGAVFSIDNAGAGYDDWIADFEITATGGSIKGIFLGNYGSYGWVEAGTKALRQNEKYVVVNDPAFTSVEVLTEDVVNFYCVFIPIEKSLVSDASISLRLFITEPVEENARRIDIGTPVTKSYEKYREFVIKDEVEPSAPAPVQELLITDTVDSVKNEIINAQILEGEETVIIRDSEGTEITDNTSKIGTGMQVVIINPEDGTEKVNTIIVKGDVDGDGDIIASDLEKALENSVDNIELDEPNSLAGDLNHDGVVDGIDVAIMEMYISGNASYSEIVSA